MREKVINLFTTTSTDLLNYFLLNYHLKVPFTFDPLSILLVFRYVFHPNYGYPQEIYKCHLTLFRICLFRILNSFDVQQNQQI